MAARALRRCHLVASILIAAATTACSSAPSSDDAATSRAALGAANARAANLDSIRRIEDHRLVGNAPLKAFLSNSDATVLAAAATAVGRIGDPSLQSNVVTLLGHKDASVRQAAAFALGLLGSSSEAALDTQLAAEHDAATRAVIVSAIGQAGTVTSVPAVTAELATSASTDEQTAAAEAYGTMVRGGATPSTDATVATRLITLAGLAPELRSVAAAYALAGLANARVKLDETALTAAFHAAAAPSARAYLTTAIASSGTTTSVQTLATAAASDADVRVRGAACDALATTGSAPPVLAALTGALKDSSNAVIVESATAIGTLAASAITLVPALDAAYDASSSAWVRATLLPTLLAVDPTTARSRVVAGLTDEWPVQLAAVGALPAIATAADVTKLITLATGSDKRLASAAIEAMTGLAPTLVTPAVKTALTAVLAKKDWELTSSVCDVAATFGWTEFAAPLNALYASFPGDANMNARLEIVYALGTIGSSADVPLLQSAIADDTMLVSYYAALSYQQLTGVDVSSQVRTENVVTTTTPSDSDIANALSSVVVLQTTRGTIAIQMLAETPLNAVNLVKLAGSGFYDGLPFHRVIPNFVAQGGDPRGDGEGGSKNLVRDELSRVPHLRGTVGLASEGKDTGSSQFFFNEAWNVHLDERYTVFGNVVYGIEAAEQLEVGDVIQSATVLRGWGAAEAPSDADPSL
jgi:cyclophilin family peptidyl-prolyl cis-trans isomerase/HEAT repeat protein